MRDGTKVRIKDMTDRHLQNTIAYLRRTVGPQRMETAISMDCHHFDPDSMAAFYTEQDAARLYEMCDDEYIAEACPLFDALVEEAARRAVRMVRK